MERKHVAVKLDESIIKEALSIAEEYNIARDSRSLLNYILIQYNKGSIKFNTSLNALKKINVNKRTTITYDDSIMRLVKNALIKEGLESTDEIAINLLFVNFTEHMQTK